jgi:hypothetical protein
VKRSITARMLGVSLTLLGATVGATVTATLASAATTLTATPATGLKDGASVAVHGTGFPASTTIYVLECSAPNQAGCDTAHLTQVMSTAAGVIDTTIVVHTGAIGNGTCAAGSSNCSISAGDAAQTASGSASIAFAAAPAAPTTAAAASSAAPTSAGTTTAAVTTSTAPAPTTVSAGTGGAADRNSGLGATEIALIVIGGLGLGASGLRLAKSRR